MMRLVPIDIDGRTAVGAEVLLPGTTLLAITIGDGYIMCGALDVALLNERLADRRIIAGRAVGVRTFDQLLEAPLESVTDTARSLGIVPGMSGRAALAAMADSSSRARA